MVDSSPPTLLHYRLVEKIGEGGMGAVWKADPNAPVEICALVGPLRDERNVNEIEGCPPVQPIYVVLT